MAAAPIVGEVAAAKGTTRGQIALAWILHKGANFVSMPGTKRRTYLEENVAAADVTLDAAQMAALDDAMAPGKAVGDRYAAGPMAKTIDR